MTNSSKINKVRQQLRQVKLKMKGLFNITQFDKLVKKHLQIANENENNLGHKAEEFLLAGIVSQIIQPRSQRDFVKELNENPVWAQSCGFDEDVPHQSSFSRKWNNEDYIEPLEGIIRGLSNLIPTKRLHYELEYPTHILRTIKQGYLPLHTDSSFITLSKDRFDYATRGYAGPEAKSEYGAKLNLIIDGMVNNPLVHTPTDGGVHETKVIDLNLKEILEFTPKWFKDSRNKKLQPLMIFDKGYWDKNRFKEWTKNNIGFIIPNKKNQLKYATLEIKHLTKNENEPQEMLVWLPDFDRPLRWILMKRKKGKRKYWNLLTSDLKLPARDIIELYTNRWSIEEVFKWLKQYTSLKRPLVNSWTGFILHSFFSILVYQLIRYFLLLIEIPRWQENVTEIWHQIVKAPDKPWHFNYLRIPLMELGLDNG